MTKKVEEFDAYFAKEEEVAREERSDSRPFAYPVRLAIRRLDEVCANRHEWQVFFSKVENPASNYNAACTPSVYGPFVFWVQGRLPV